MPDDASHPAGQLQSARVLGRRLEQSFQSRTQVGRAADIRLSMGLGAVECKDCGDLRQLSQRGPRIGRIKGELLHSTLESMPQRHFPSLILAVHSAKPAKFPLAGLQANSLTR